MTPDSPPEPAEGIDTEMVRYYAARARLAAAGLTADVCVRDAWAEPDRAVDGLFAGF